MPGMRGRRADGQIDRRFKEKAEGGGIESPPGGIGRQLSKEQIYELIAMDDVVALLERIAFQTSGTRLEIEDYLKEIRGHAASRKMNHGK